jgi:hypothetical protein
LSAQSFGLGIAICCCGFECSSSQKIFRLSENKGVFMDIKKFTMIYGAFFILAGVAAFIPGVTVAPHMHDPNLAVDAGYGRFLGLLPVNVLHNLVHLALGLWALVAARDVAHARTYCKAVTIIYGALAILGLIPGVNTMFGLVPIFGHDVWFHLLVAAAAGYYGFVRTTDRTESRDASGANLRWS